MANESEGFAVTSDPLFLYHIGRICAESGKFMDEGLSCLNDFLLINEYHYPSTLKKIPSRIKINIAKAKYMAGVMYYKTRDYDEAEMYLNQAIVYLSDDSSDFELYQNCERLISTIFKEKFKFKNIMWDYFYPEYNWIII